MEPSDEEDQPRVPDQNTLMEEALRILNEEGFTLPNDVVDTLENVGRTNANARRRGPPLRSHRVCEVQSSQRRFRNAREATRRSSSRDSSSDERPREREEDMSRADEVFETNDEPKVDPNDGSDSDSSRSRNMESETSSTCTTSTVREAPERAPLPAGVMPLTRQDSGSSLASSASSYNRKLAQMEGAASSHGSDTGYDTSLENAMQVHEARADNLKNYTKHMENQLSEKGRTHPGLRREISRDSGFTESGDLASRERTPVAASPPHLRLHQPLGNDTKDFKDISVSNSDTKERIISTDSGDAHQVTSSASNLTGAEMTQRSNKMTDDGTAISTAAKLENQEYNSGLSRLTNKILADGVSKEDEHQSENRRTKSSRNDTIATTASGVTTASSRHALSMDQELNNERATITASGDGRSMASEMEVTQKLSREQEMNNLETSDDGTSKAETKTISEKAAMSKTHREEQMTSEDGLTTGAISGTHHQESTARTSQGEDKMTNPDGSVCTQKHDRTESTSSEQSSSEQKTVKQNPYTGASSTELVKKSDSSSVSKSSSSVNQVLENSQGRSSSSQHEDSNSASSSFSGVCESTDVVNNMKIHRTKTSEQSSESKMKSSKSSSSYSSKGSSSNDSMLEDGGGHFNRRLSNSSNASTLSNMSGLSRENILPPSYEETVNNLSRQSSVLSRQDSCGSSIASSASALNEKMRQKRLAEAETESRASNDSQTRLKQVVDSSYDRRNPPYNRSNSYSSDSTISGGVTNNVYENVDGVDYFDDASSTSSSGRFVNHPVRQQTAYTRSATDSVVRDRDRGSSRRYTMHGDVGLSERELAEARQEVRSKVRGRDDTFLKTRAGELYSERSYSSDSRPRSRKRDESSFEREVMDLVDQFFEDDFGFGDFPSGGRKSSNRDRASNRRRTTDDYNPDYKPVSSRSAQNPYSARQDLSALRDEADEALKKARETSSSSASDYAASDSGYPRNHRYSGNYMSPDDGQFPDSVSDSGYNRYSRGEDRYSGLGAFTDNIGSPRRRQENQYQFSDPSSRPKTYASADDNLQRAGKSMNGDRNINTSISGGNRHYEYAGRTTQAQKRHNSYNNVNGSNLYKMFVGDTVSDRFEGESVSDADSTCPSFTSLPAYRMSDEDSEDFRTQSLPDITDGKLPKDDPRWNNRRERIDNALTWIRSELGHLRTQDKVLMSQFQRCQDSIESLKKQRPWYEVFSDDEEEEDERHWEDWEIEDFDRSCQNEREREREREQRERERERETTRSRSSAASDSKKSGVVITKEYQRMSIKSTK